MKKESKTNSIKNSKDYKNSLQDLLKKSLNETRSPSSVFEIHAEVAADDDLAYV